MRGIKQLEESVMADLDERRGADRDRMEQLVEIRWEAGGEDRSETGLLQNFSLRGLYLHAGVSLKEHLPAGKEVSCKFHTPPDLPTIGGQPLICHGKVSRVDELEEPTETIGIAVEIDTILIP